MHGAHIGGQRAGGSSSWWLTWIPGGCCWSESMSPRPPGSSSFGDLTARSWLTVCGWWPTGPGWPSSSASSRSYQLAAGCCSWWWWASRRPAKHQSLTAHLGRPRRAPRAAAGTRAQVAAIRKQQGNRRRKTDWLDAAAVCELLARGEGTLVSLDASMAASLRPLWSGRKDLVDTRSRLRQQAGALVDCLWPGFSAADKQAGVSPVLFATCSRPRPAG